MKRVLFLTILITMILYSCDIYGFSADDGITIGTYSQTRVVKDVGWCYGDFTNNGSAYAVVPGLKQNFVPQGMSVSKNLGWVLICGYFSDGSPSTIFILDYETGNFIKSVVLKKLNGDDYTGHAGGLAITDTNVYIANGNKLFRIAVSQIQAISDDHQGVVQFDAEIKVPVRASFCNYSAGKLWVGDFEYGNDYATDEFRHIASPAGTSFKAWSVAYELETENLEDIVTLDSDNIAIPDTILAIPSQIQGMTIIGDTVILSRSWGAFLSSDLYVYKNIMSTSSSSINYAGKSIPIRYLENSSRTKSIAIPPMMEGIDSVDNKVFILFESGAQKFVDTFPPRRDPMDSVWCLNLENCSCL